MPLRHISLRSATRTGPAGHFGEQEMGSNGEGRGVIVPKPTTNGSEAAIDLSNGSPTSSGNSMFGRRVGSAIFYSLSSVLIMVINKQVLSIYKFPSFKVVGIGQMFSTIVVLRAAKGLGYVTYPVFGADILTRIFPLPLLYAGNMLSGLGGTQSLSLPMLTALRRFSILMTMVAEGIVLNVKTPRKVQIAVLVMVFGAIVAAVNDLGFSPEGYVYLLLNDVCTTGIGVVSKQKMNNNVGKYGLMYYNSLLMIVPTVLLAHFTGDISKARDFEGWNDPAFVLCFFLTCVFGFILMLSSMLCVQFNSALTTAIIGALKNIFITYLGMFYGGDYEFDVWNFVGLNISASASIYYTRLTFGGGGNNNRAKEEKSKGASMGKAVSPP